MSLQDKLDEYKAGFKQKAPIEAQQTMERATEELIATGQHLNAPKVGEKFPEFALPNQNGEVVRLSDLLAKGPVVVSFFRGLWCPYCNIEVKALAEAQEEIAALGASLVLVSPQTVEFSAKTVRQHKLGFDALSDEGNAFARSLGTVFTLPEDVKAIYQAFGISLPAHNGDESWDLPMPARFAIGTDGTVLWADINPDYTKRPDPAETIAALKAATAAA